MGNKSAPKETIETLTDNVGKAIQDLYVSIRKDIADRSVMNAIQSSVYLRTEDVRIGAKFVIMDLGISCKALFTCNNPFEKRHHMKNLFASISEGYKLLLGFGRARKYTLWSILQEEVCKIGDISFIDECDAITSRLETFASKCIDQDIRNLTLHYDDNMMRVYDKTVSLNNEDTIVHYVCEFWAILQDVLIFCNKVDGHEEVTNHITKPERIELEKLNINNLHDSIRMFIGKNGQLENVLTEIIPKASQQLDVMADTAKSIQRIRLFVQKKIIDADFPEIDNIAALTNCELLIRFMIIDLASIINAYLRSVTAIESSLNLRRVIVIKTSTFVHLFGYNKEEYDKSVWKSIKSFIPDDNKELLEESMNIEGILRKVVTNTIDKELRASMVHLYDHNERRSNIENVVSAVESLNPLQQIVEMLLLIHLYKRIQSFTKNLMDVLVNNAHQQRLETQKQVEEMIDSFWGNMESCQISPELKASFLETTNKIKSWLD